MLKDRATLFGWDFTQPNNFGVAPAEREIRHSNIFLLSDRPISPISSTWDWWFVLPDILMSITYTERIDLAFRCTNQHSKLGTFSILGPTELFQIVFLPLIQQMGDHTDLPQEERLDLRCLTKISAACVVVDVSKYLDILTLKFP